MSWVVNREEGEIKSWGLGEGVGAGEDPRIIGPLKAGSLSLGLSPHPPSPSMWHKVGLQYSVGGKEGK